MMLSPILMTDKCSPSAPSASRTNEESGREEKALNALSLAEPQRTSAGSIGYIERRVKVKTQQARICSNSQLFALCCLNLCVSNDRREWA